MSAVTKWIEQYAAGQITMDALLDNLHAFPFRKPDYMDSDRLPLGEHLTFDHVYPEDGTWEEVTYAFDSGTLSAQEYYAINEEFAA